ncbi:unnamed protein product [Hymenolepis diminuta]|nr:unnamed protein product [Hymenolepis diminuta]
MFYPLYWYLLPAPRSRGYYSKFLISGQRRTSCVNPFVCSRCRLSPAIYVQIIVTYKILRLLSSKLPDLVNPVCKSVNHSVTHFITTHENSVKSRVPRLSPTQYKITMDEFEHMLNLGIIHHFSNNWSSALHMVPKKSGDWGPCGYHCALSSITIPDSNPIPDIQDFSSNLRNKKIFSKIDLVRAHNQISIAEADILKISVAIPFDPFDFLRMPFSLCNAAQTFQRLIDEALHGPDFAIAYIDNILVTRENEEEHKKHLKIVFERLNFHGLIIYLSKSGIG